MIFDFTLVKKSSISFAIGIKSYCILPHVGHEINVGELGFNPQYFSISFATFISFIGSADNDTLIVLPIPSLNKFPESYTRVYCTTEFCSTMCNA